MLAVYIKHHYCLNLFKQMNNFTIKNTFSGKVKFVDTRCDIFLHMWATVLAKMSTFKVQSVVSELLRMTLEISDSFKVTNQLTPKYWLQFKQYFSKYFTAHSNCVLFMVPIALWLP